MSDYGDECKQLVYETEVLLKCGIEYAEVAKELRILGKDLIDCLENLKLNGWTTPAGIEFHRLVDETWKKQIDLYADLLDTLNEILIESSKRYDVIEEKKVQLLDIKRAIQT